MTSEQSDDRTERIEEFLDELACAKEGSAIVLDEAASIGSRRAMNPHMKKHLVREMTKLTPERMQKRIDYYREKIQNEF